MYFLFHLLLLFLLQYRIYDEIKLCIQSRYVYTFNTYELVGFKVRVSVSGVYLGRFLQGGGLFQAVVFRLGFLLPLS